MINFFRCLMFFAFHLSAHTPTINPLVQAYMQKHQIPGIAIALFYENKGYILTYGVSDRQKQTPVSGDTIFELASLTKVFTTTDLALQVEQGRMRLDDALSQYLPNVNGPMQRITLKQLATHTSSLPRELPPLKHRKYDKQRVHTFLQNWNPSYPIGSRYLYSNLGFGLLGYAEENLWHEPYELILDKDILYPLEMRSTWIDVPEENKSRYAQGYSKEGRPVPHTPRGLLPASGALRSTAADMLKFLEANLGVNTPAALHKAMQEAQSPFFRVNDHLTLGLGWQRFKRNGMLIIDKNGGLPGFSSYIGMIPQKKIGIVILANKAKINSTLLGRQLLQYLSGEQQSQN